MALINKSIVVIIFLKVNLIGGQLFNGDECFHSKTGKKGICKPLKQCQEDIANLRKNITPQQCGFENMEVIVCCLENVASIFQTRLPGDISKQKCQDYSQYVYKTVLNPTLLVGGGTVKADECFLKKQQLVENGRFARRQEFPHLAIIGFGKTEYSNIDWLCGGSLISEKHVLTVAHCTVSIRGPPQKVRLGTISLDEDDPYAQEIIVSSFVNHPKYKIREKYHDISILFLKNNVQFSSSVRPACLKSPIEIITNKAIATGFAKYRLDSDDKSNILLRANLVIISNENCNRYSQTLQTITDQMICAEDTQQQLETCQGNAGATLQVLLKEPYCMYRIIGESLNEICGVPHSLNIYTKVDSYIAWIESTVWPEEVSNNNTLYA